MAKKHVIYESFSKIDFILIRNNIKRDVSVWVIEPFPAYHHNKKGSRFFPSYLPGYITALINKGQISLLRAEDINAKEIYGLAADKAVQIVEYVYPEYRKEHSELFDYVANTLKSPITEDGFKMGLCNSIAEFYSVNMLLQRIAKIVGEGRVAVYPDTNVHTYLKIKRILEKSRQDYFKHSDIFFPFSTHVSGWFENIRNGLFTAGRLGAQTIASGIFEKVAIATVKKKKEFKYGVAVVGSRQLQGTKRGPDFIIDNIIINPEDVVYFPLFDLNREQRDLLEKVPGTIHYPPQIGKFYSNFKEWKKLVSYAVRKNYLRNAGEIHDTSTILFNYFRWKRVTEQVRFKHFITHCDFGSAHIGRNIALSQAGITTWYYTDSMNHGNNFIEEGKECMMRHPFWTYLHYDHFVTWDEALVKYYNQHPGSLKHNHVVGCLWSGHTQEINRARDVFKIIPSEYLKNRFVIAVFDTTYSTNGVTSYNEGIAFAKHIFTLVEEFTDIYVLLKEKKNRSIHKTLDPVNGRKLLELYDKLDTHQRITICSNEADTTDIISVSDLVISFPFTSTTFEALSIKRPAVWHDPIEYYKNTPYGKAEGVMTHGYMELKAKVLEMKKMNPQEYHNPLHPGSPLMDPYCDGKAIDRFRELLHSS